MDSNFRLAFRGSQLSVVQALVEILGTPKHEAVATLLTRMKTELRLLELGGDSTGMLTIPLNTGITHPIGEYLRQGDIIAQGDAVTTKISRMQSACFTHGIPTIAFRNFGCLGELQKACPVMFDEQHARRPPTWEQSCDPPGWYVLMTSPRPPAEALESVLLNPWNFIRPSMGLVALASALAFCHFGYCLFRDHLVSCRDGTFGWAADGGWMIEPTYEQPTFNCGTARAIFLPVS